MAHSITTAPIDIMLRHQPTMFAMPIGIIRRGEQFRYRKNKEGWVIVPLPGKKLGYYRPPY